MTRRIVAVLLPAVVLAATPARADVTYFQEGQLSIKLPFGIGNMKTRVYISGDRRREEQGDKHATITRLDQETVYTLEPKKKKYYKRTFAEIRAELEASLAEMEKNVAEARKDQPEGKPAEAEVTVDVKSTGRSDTIAGFACKETRVRVTVEGKDPDSGTAGSMALDNDLCLSTAFPGAKEVRDFDMRYAEKLGAAQILAANAMFDMSGKRSDAMFKARIRMSEEQGKVDGFPLRVVTRFGNAAQQTEGGFGFTMEVKEAATGAVDAALFEVPAGFKEEPPPQRKKGK